MPEEKIGKLLDKFWTEHTAWKNGTGVFGGRDYIYQSDLCSKGLSHQWHLQYSVPYTEVFGYVACHVTSKPIGTGMSERVWKKVKIVDSRQHCGRMGTDAMEKQATLYGSAKMKKHRLLGKYKVYDFSDLDANLGLKEFETFEHERQLPQKRTFNAWIEDWEKELLQKRNQKAEAKLLKKYKNLLFVDDNDNKLYEVAPENLEWKGSRKERGWCVVAQPPGWKDGDDENLLQSRAISAELITLIVKYKQPANLQLEVIEKSNEDDTDTDESEEKSEEEEEEDEDEGETSKNNE